MTHDQPLEKRKSENLTCVGICKIDLILCTAWLPLNVVSGGKRQCRMHLVNESDGKEEKNGTKIC